MEVVRYRPGEAIRWLETGAREMKKSAERKGRSFVRREGARSVGRDVREAAGAFFDFGKSALAEFIQRQADATEYTLLDQALEIRTGSRQRTIPYADIKRLVVRNNHRVVIELDQGSVLIKPVAILVAGSLRVPVGWTRNDLEVPYELLFEELAARAGVDIEHA